MPDPGPLFGGRYRLEDEIGRGGMGVVHRAWDVRLHRYVAVKILRNSSGQDRFRVEGQTLGLLSHPGLVTVFDADIADHEPYLVMELVDGGPLTHRIRDRRMDPAEVAALGTDLADALAHVHSHRIVHRDVKPANILLSRTGRVKLADFGVARLLDGLTRHTDTGMIMGTAAYLSPEQVRGEAVTGASDVYSLGLVLIEALTGEPAYTGPWQAAALARLASPPWIDPTWPVPLPGLLAGMTASDPADRPTAATVAEVLRTVPAVAPAPAPASSVESEHTEPMDAVTSTGPGLVPGPWADAPRSRAQHGLLVAAALLAPALLIPALLLAFHVNRAGALEPAATAQVTTATSPATTPTPKAAVDAVSTSQANAALVVAKSSSSTKKTPTATHRSNRRPGVSTKSSPKHAAAHGPSRGPSSGPGPGAPGGPGRGGGPGGPGPKG